MTKGISGDRRNLFDVNKNNNYLWPSTLCMPKRPPKIVYLDLNHWIALARTMSGRDNGEKDRKLLRFCLDSVEQKVAVYPISLNILVEILKIRDYKRRRNLRKVIEQLSQFIVVANRAAVAEHEIETMLDQTVGPNPNPIESMDFLNWGVLRAMGRDDGIRIISGQGEDVTAEYRRTFAEGPEEFDRIISEARWELNRQVLDGPAPDEETRLREQGYNPEAVLEDYENEARAEKEQAHRLDSEQQWRRGRLRDLVSVRELAFQIDSIHKKACHARSIDSFETLCSTIDDARTAFDSMPSFDTSVTLKTAIHRNGGHRWRNNDIHDIHALTVALPYCDVVVTDKAMATITIQSKLDQRLNTVVDSNLYELPHILE